MAASCTVLKSFTVCLMQAVFYYLSLAVLFDYPIVITSLAIRFDYPIVITSLAVYFDYSNVMISLFFPIY